MRLEGIRIDSENYRVHKRQTIPGGGKHLKIPDSGIFKEERGHKSTEGVSVGL